jgi:hypothetical protein
VFLRVLGPLVIEVGDPPVGVAVPGAKERAVLGRLLVCPGRAVPVDVLVDTAVYGGEDGQVRLFDTDAAVQYGLSLPVFADAGTGDPQIAPVVDRHLALFAGWRTHPQIHEGVVYPLDPADWLAHACSIVRRNLTPAEWNVHLPGRPYRPTCG